MTDSLITILTELREFIAPLWFAYKDSYSGSYLDPDDDHSEGMCKVTSVFLQHALSTEAPEVGWHITGGLGEGSGMLVDGAWREHFWVSAGDGTIVDLTATQFGGPAVVLLTPGAPEARFYEGMPSAAADLCDHSSIVWDWIAEWDERQNLIRAPSHR